MDGMNRAARMAYLMSILREVLVRYFKVLVCCNRQKRVQKTFRDATPVTSSEFMDRIVYTNHN